MTLQIGRLTQNPNLKSEASIETLKNYALLKLNDRDRAVFASALLDNQSPSEQALADAKWYKQIMNN